MAGSLIHDASGELLSVRLSFELLELWTLGACRTHACTAQQIIILFFIYKVGSLDGAHTVTGVGRPAKVVGWLDHAAAPPLLPPPPPLPPMLLSLPLPPAHTNTHAMALRSSHLAMLHRASITHRRADGSAVTNHATGIFYHTSTHINSHQPAVGVVVERR